MNLGSARFGSLMMRECLTSAGIFCALLFFCSSAVRAQEAVPSSVTAAATPAESPNETFRSPSELKKLSLEQLADFRARFQRYRCEQAASIDGRSQSLHAAFFRCVLGCAARVSSRSGTNRSDPRSGRDLVGRERGQWRD